MPISRHPVPSPYEKHPGDRAGRAGSEVEKIRVTTWSKVLGYLQNARISAKQRGKRKVARATGITERGNDARPEIRNEML